MHLKLNWSQKVKLANRPKYSEKCSKMQKIFFTKIMCSYLPKCFIRHSAIIVLNPLGPADLHEIEKIRILDQPRIVLSNLLLINIIKVRLPDFLTAD